jgi:hypothetical protein
MTDPKRRSAGIATACMAAAALLLFVAPVHAQQTPADTTKPKTTRDVVLGKLRNLSQSEVRDTTIRDTAAPTVRETRPAPPRQQQGSTTDFPTDSVMRELLKLTDFAATQYRGSSADFVADSQRLVLFGTPNEKAGVVRDGQTMTADSLLTFDEVTSVACGYGKPVLSGDATNAPVESRLICYDTKKKIGMAAGARTQVNEGANWFVTGDLYSRDKDVYTHDARFTDCSLETPHYHFGAKEVKIVNGDVMVARNVTLNFGDVPVFWMPFMMQSMKRGRRSGILMPEFSINDIVRRNSNYNRRISNIGAYWAISENLGSKVALDWWSDNYTALEGSFDFNYPRRFLSGGLTMKRFWQQSGRKEFTLAAGQNWEPSERMSIRTDAQYTSSTEMIQESSFDPRELRRQITSAASISRRFDWGSLNLGATRNQDLSTKQVDLTLPSVGVTFPTVTLFRAVGEGSWYNNATWTSNASLSRRQTQFAEGDIDPTGITSNVSSNFNLGKIAWSQSFTANLATDRRIRAADTIAVATQRLGWNSTLSYQQRLIGTSTFTPGISVGQELLRNDTIPGNPLLRAPIRMDANAAVRVDLFGFWPGVGPIERLRHKLSPDISYTYSPEATINPLDSLRVAVFGRAGTRERNQISIGLNQSIEGKYKEEAKREGQRADSAAIDSTTTDPSKPRRLPQARKVTILSLNTSAVAYDFVAARETHGIQTLELTNSVNSDLLRGLQLTLSHELFRPLIGDNPTGEEPGTGTTGNLLEADREFAPHLRRVSASFSLSNNSWLFQILGLTKKTDAPPPTGSQETPLPANAEGGPSPTGTVRPEYGMIGNRERETSAPSRGPIGSWNASFNLTMERPREDALPGIAAQGNEMMTTNVSFQPTQQWNVTWSTGYSFSTKNFTDHILTFTRQMHDWDANFNFMKAQNGNFSFVFNVKLRANPDIKFDYSQRSNVRTLQ